MATVTRLARPRSAVKVTDHDWLGKPPQELAIIRRLIPRFGTRIPVIAFHGGADALGIGARG